mmetsp:Transcript_12416/g.16316  ORF Transcript_12416/g.16316 Transcript_12416/m.16316 type:complete len:318 (+) Transcript_12416:76-1029(+)|eukprot:CAMPEP_0198143904 /NCGR_PEP_ID=MMETSP1443-20131203/11542_1 /TAXON_ID=186043 /ORGANISM="Entomoneis sp., Strain CCMP2396" /LENGTH=317 /DNA_ID=CAMNT_0043807209 /DNA_START=1 /DNA_END=954 /DNA_ORIENTATION=-
MTSSDYVIKMSDLMKPGHTAVVTGASSGIGKAASLAFAKSGMNVWMLDIDGAELLEAQKFVKQQAAQTDQLILAEKVDVSDPKAMESVAEQVFSTGNNCNVLMNNAGVGTGGGAIDTDLETMEKTFGVNLYGPIHGVKAFVPKMKESKEPGIIINTGSKQGITMPPGNLTYNMSKAALKCFTEGLEHELMKDRLESDGKLRAALFVPGWVNTSIVLKVQRAKAADPGNFDENSVFFHEGKPASGAWMPGQVVDFMVKELDEGRFYIICPDNDVDRETDSLRMTWTMQDITENRAPLSRWHPDYKDAFAEFMEKSKST